MLLIGYFEGLSSERAIAWRVADSLSLRSSLDLDVTEASADHSTLSQTRRLIDVETYEAVFAWVLERLSAAGLVRGKTVSVDATALEANAAMRSIERRNTGESYEAFIRRLAEASGVETPTQAELDRFDRSRKNEKTSNKEGLEVDTATLPATLIMAAEQVELVQPDGSGVEEAVADKEYHSEEDAGGARRDWGSQLRIGAGAGSALLAGQEDGGDAAGEACCAAGRCMRTVGVWAGGGFVGCNAAGARWWSRLFAHMYETGHASCVGCAATTMSASGC